MLPNRGLSVSKRSDGSVGISRAVGKRDPGKYKALQSFKAECDINLIMDKVRKKQVHLQDLIRQDASYGDYSEAGDFMSAQKIIVHAKEQFAALPSRTRERFGNDPAKLLEFVHDDRNLAEARSLGLLKPEETKAEEAPVPKGKGARQPKGGSADAEKADPPVVA